MKTTLLTISTLLLLIIFSTTEMYAQQREGGTFNVSGTVSVSTSTTGETTVQVNTKDEGEAPNDPIIVKADSNSPEDIEKAKNQAGRELLDQLLGSNKVMAGPDGQGDYRGAGGSMPTKGKGDIPMPDTAPGDIVIFLNPVVVFGDKMPPMKVQYDGIADLKKNFIMDFTKALGM